MAPAAPAAAALRVDRRADARAGPPLRSAGGGGERPLVLNARDAAGDGPLHLAAAEGHAGVVEALLDLGAEAHARAPTHTHTAHTHSVASPPPFSCPHHHIQFSRPHHREKSPLTLAARGNGSNAPWRPGRALGAREQRTRDERERERERVCACVGARPSARAGESESDCAFVFVCASAFVQSSASLTRIS